METVLPDELEKAFNDCKAHCIESRLEPDKIDCNISHLKKQVALAIIEAGCQSYDEGHDDGYKQGIGE